MNNSHLIKVKYQGPTNYKGSRVYLSTWDVSHYNNKKSKGLTVGLDHTFNSSDDQAVEILKRAGLEIMGMNERGSDTYIMCKWDFEKLAKLFKVEIRD